MPEKEIAVSGLYPLFGTLLIPEQVDASAPLVLILGANRRENRNGPAPGTGQGVYAALATAMADAGFPSFRFDLRGTGKSGGIFLETGFWESVDDAQMVLATLKEQPELKNRRTILLCHNEGCRTGIALSNRQPPYGMILIGLNLEDPEIVLRQLFAATQPAAGLLRRSLRKLGLHRTPEAVINRLILKIKSGRQRKIKLGKELCNAIRLRELFLYDTAAAIQSIKTRILAIAPVGPLESDARRIAEAASAPAIWRIINSLNLQFLNRDPVPGATEQPGPELHPDLTETLISWLKTRAKPPRNNTV